MAIDVFESDAFEDLWAQFACDTAVPQAEQRVIGFGDLLHQVDRALHGPQQEAVLDALKARYRVVLVDEFQDTDPLQSRILQRAFKDGAVADRVDEAAGQRQPGRLCLLATEPVIRAAVAAPIRRDSGLLDSQFSTFTLTQRMCVSAPCVHQKLARACWSSRRITRGAP